MSPKEFKNEMIRLRDETCGYKHYGDFIDKETRHFNMDMLMVKNFKGSRLWRRCRHFCQDR